MAILFRRLACGSVAILLTLVASVAAADAPAQARNRDLQNVRALLKQPEEKIDLARTKLIIDRMIDPSIDVESNVRRLDAMADTIRASTPFNASNVKKLQMLARHLYIAGPWNDYRPYRYDFDDPFASDIRSKLLPTYLTTKKGNCISMPLLVIVLGQKLGIDLTAATAPAHVFVKYRDDHGNFQNMEATSGSTLTDSAMRGQMPMTDKAVKNGLYMRPLTKRETVAVMAGTLLEFHAGRDEQEQRIAFAKLALEYYPKDEPAMRHMAVGYHELMKREFRSKYPSFDDIPKELHARYVDLVRNRDAWLNKAKALGWQPEDPSWNATYLQRIRQAKLNQ